jgi:hypothetical protein
VEYLSEFAPWEEDEDADGGLVRRGSVKLRLVPRPSAACAAVAPAAAAAAAAGGRPAAMAADAATAGLKCTGDAVKEVKEVADDRRLLREEDELLTGAGALIWRRSIVSLSSASLIWQSRGESVARA